MICLLKHHKLIFRPVPAHMSNLCWQAAELLHRMVWQFFSAFLQRLICVRWYVIENISYIAVKNAA